LEGHFDYLEGRGEMLLPLTRKPKQQKEQILHAMWLDDADKIAKG